MSKNNRKNTHIQSEKNNKTTSHINPKPNRKSKISNLLVKFRLFIFLFVVVDVFLYVWYGDTLLVAEQRSFFTFDPTPMQAYITQSFGWLYAIGRFMLLSCVSPLAGATLISLMLVLSSWLLSQAFSFKGWAYVVSIILPFCYFGYLFYMGLNLVYLRELSWIMTIPLCILLICIVIALIAKLIKKQKIVFSSLWEKAEISNPRQGGVLLGLLLALFVGSIAVAETYAQNDRITCSLEKLMYEEDWDGMVKKAKTASHPSRTVVGLYALALNQNGQMGTELFNIPMQYRNAHLSRKDGSFDGGIHYIVIYCNFYAGLTRSAYHESMEQVVLDGPSINKLKIMIKCAIIDKENALAQKYLDILKKVPFENDFVEKYSNMLNDYNLVLQDAELASVIDLQPVKDSFEQNYREPLFLGYNVKLVEAKSIRGLYNSLYACLYSKDMIGFGDRVLTMINNKMMLPKVVEEAVIVRNIKNLKVLSGMNISQYTLQGMKDFMDECFAKDQSVNAQMSKEEKNEINKKKARKYIDKYLGTYQFYYYFQNIPDENYVQTGPEENSGVN